MVLWFGLKKVIREMGKKIKGDITELTSQSLNNRILVEKLNDNVKGFVNRDEIKLLIENAVLKSQTERNPEQYAEPKSEQLPEPSHFEKVMIRKANITRPKMIKQVIRGLLEKGMRTTEIFDFVVEEKKMVGKTQFYHYLTLIRAELNQTKPRTKLEGIPEQ